MIFIKILIYILVLATSMGIGILLSNKYVYREKELKEFKKALSIFKTKIKFTYEPIPTIFGEISNSIKGNVGEVFNSSSNIMNNVSAGHAWNMALEEKNNLYINKEDITILKTLSNLLREN